jgi:tRNA pseudouridine38-40 synthase
MKDEVKTSEDVSSPTSTFNLYPSSFRPTVRYKLTIAYRGTRYHGWQTQGVPDTWTGQRPPEGQGIATVQETLSRTIATVVGHPVEVCGSSRTDAGVHAKGQVAHFDTPMTQIPPEGLRRAVNSRLPEDVLIRSIEPVPETFNAITGTHSKRYQYAIWRGIDRPLFAADLLWHRWQPLDVAAMRQAAAWFVGTHDFASFAKPGHGRENTVRTVLDCSVTERGPRLIVGVAGKGFLWRMVRIMVGTLVEVGLGRFGQADIAPMLAAKDRQAAGPTAPPHGLYLQWIRYGDGEARIENRG